MFVVVDREMFKRGLHSFITANHKCHIGFAFLIRLIFVIYGIYHDSKSVVQYTDVDYKVFTDAARHIINNNSPYERHTYRYTPLIAILLGPNLLIHYAFGKILFCIIDLMVGALIFTIVKSAMSDYENFNNKNRVESKTQQIDVNTGGSEVSNCQHSVQEEQWSKKHKVRQSKKIKLENNKIVSETELTANISMLLWLYNPMSIAIATRGNCDSIAGLLVLITLYLLQCKKAYFSCGLIHGFAIHTRLYPIAYSLALFMYLSKYSFYSIDHRRKSTTEFNTIQNSKDDTNEQIVLKSKEKCRKTIFDVRYLLYLVPNIDQLSLIVGCFISLTALTSFFYYIYGYKFLYETYIYHLVRTDTRHNFSLYFYLQYLTAGVKNIGMWQKVLLILPQLVLLLVLSVRYGLNRFALNFSILTLTIVMVTFNSVLTSQYFIWIMAVLPLCWWQIRMSVASALFWGVIWIIAQGAWLLPAYFLEFRGQNTFLLIWIQGVAFFCVNIAILGRLIMNFVPRVKYKLM